MKVLACATLALLVGTPVLADPSGNYTANLQVSSGTEIDNDSTESTRGLDTRLEGTHSDACVRLMERAFYMTDPVSLSRALDARHEMELARNAFHTGDEFTCKRHAVLALEDRSSN